MILRTILKHCLSSAFKYIPFYNSTHPGSIYLFKDNNENIGTTRETCSKLTIKTLKIFNNLPKCFCTWVWTIKYQLGITSQFFTENCKTYRNLAKTVSVSKLTPVRYSSSVKFINNIFDKKFNNIYNCFLLSGAAIKRHPGK